MVESYPPPMTLNEYQDLAEVTDQKHPLAYYILEICNEAGELASPLKKHIFRGKELDRQAVLSEMGDVLWPLAMLARKLGFTLEEVAAENLRKLQARHG